MTTYTWTRIKWSKPKRLCRRCRDNFIYMQVEWKINSASYKLICPCRFINFPNPNKNDNRYIQPISGNVLVEYEHRFYIAYVAAHVTKKCAEKTELILRDRISVLRLKHYPFRLRPRSALRSIMYALIQLVTAPFSYFFTTDEFYRVINLNAKCTFFTYDEH